MTTSSPRRAVITGAGIVSSLGNSLAEVEASLRAGVPRIEPVPLWRELGLRCHVAGLVHGVDELAEKLELPRRHQLAMSKAALFAALAARQAVDDAGLAPATLASRRTGAIVGSGVGSATTIHRGAVDVYAGKARRIDPYAVLKSMSSATSAAIVHLLGIGGRSYSLASACATSAHTIGHAAELVRAGVLDVAIAGGAEEIDELVAAAFSALRSALASRFNDRPAEASRPFAADRDGFVPASGGAIVIVESEEHARARGARIRAELAGFGTTSEGFDLVLPEPGGEAAAAAMAQALDDAGATSDAVGYVNAHATATVAGDLAEAAALRRVFGGRLPPISSTKSLGGHALGATGAIELVHCLLMLEGGFLAPSANSTPRDPELADLPVIEETRAARPELLLSNSFGFGGANAVLALRRHAGPGGA
jgi:3-oxoacyl-[acyl-carrier-protein] synthase-1